MLISCCLSSQSLNIYEKTLEPFLGQLNGSEKEQNISIYFFFPPITEWCPISDVLFTGLRGMSDFSVLKYY